MKLSDALMKMRERVAALEEDLNLRMSYGGPDPSPTQTACVKQEIMWTKQWLRVFGEVTEL